MRSLFSSIALMGLAIAGCGAEAEVSTAGEESSARARSDAADRTADTTADRDVVRRRPDVIECRSDDNCPRGSYCELGLNYCFTGQRCVVDGRPSDELCQRTFGENFICLEYAPQSYHCVPINPPEENMCRSRIACRTDDACPRGSFCESTEHYCLTGERCLIDSRPPHDNCARLFGENFVCGRTPGAGGTHCLPLELISCE